MKNYFKNYSKLLLLTLCLLSVTPCFAQSKANRGSANEYKNESTYRAEDNRWIQIGEVTCYPQKGNGERIYGNLQMMEIGDKIVYRLEYNGQYYSIRHNHYESRTRQIGTNSHEVNEYLVSINGVSYKVLMSE